MSYKCTDRLNADENGNITWKNQDKVFLSKNLAYRDQFVKKIVSGATKSKTNKKTYIDQEGRPFVLKMTNDYIRQNPTTFKKGNFFLYRDQHKKLKTEKGYYVFIVFKTPSGYDQMKIDSDAFFVREHMECICWQSVQHLAEERGTVEAFEE